MTTYHMPDGILKEWQCVACGAHGSATVHGCGIPNNPDGNRFFVDLVEYRDPRPTARVSDLFRAHCPQHLSRFHYTLFLEQGGDRPDMPLASHCAVDLRLTPRMYFVPPACM